jgi:hypothetical protein
MGTAREIIQTAYRKLGVVPLLQAPSAAQAQIALTELNRLIYNYVGFGTSFPFEMVRADQAVELDPDDPALRVALQNTAAITITLPKYPVDGARLQIVDPNNTLSTAPVTLARSGWQIEGAAADLVLNTNGLNRVWMYRGDTGNWTRAADIALDDQMPFPVDFDRAFSLLLARSLAGEFGLRLTPEDQGYAKDGHTRLRARYVKPPKQYPSTDIQWSGGAVWQWPWGSYLRVMGA